MYLISTTKCYRYKTESEQKKHQTKMEKDGYRVWSKVLLKGEWSVDYVKEQTNKATRLKRIDLGNGGYILEIEN